MFEQTSAFLKKPIGAEVFERMDSANREFLSRHESLLKTLSSGDTEKISDIDQRDLLRGHLESLNLTVNKQLFFSFDREDNFEIWSTQLRFLATGNQLIKRLSYSIEDLLTRDWKELFVRDSEGERQIGAAIGQLLSGNDLILDVAPHHAVWEREASGARARVQVKALAIANDRDTRLPGAFVAITNIKDHAAI